MGEIADQMVNGSCCDLCLTPFIKNNKEYEHGHPATCKDCWSTLTNEEKEHHQKQDKGVSTL